MARKNMDSREVGLVVGLIFARYFLHTDDLHYGFWPDDLPVTPDNLQRAQEHHSDLILSSIPDGVKSILDVGCGGGALARRLLDRGYEVDGVSPSGPLTAHAKQRVGKECTIFESKFEEVKTAKRYDLILFSESYQYMKLERSFEQIQTLLNPNGYLLICDFFRKPKPERGPIRGGHRWEAFQEELGKYPFDNQLDQDITKETARNYDLVNELLTEVGVPVWDLLFAYGEANYPKLTKALRRIYRNKIDKLETKYFRGLRTAETFTEYKTYRLLRYQWNG